MAGRKPQLFIPVFILLNSSNDLFANYHSHSYQGRENLAMDTQSGPICFLLYCSLLQGKETWNFQTPPIKNDAVVFPTTLQHFSTIN